MKKIWPWILGLSVLLILVVFVFYGTGLLSIRRSPMVWGGETGRLWGNGYWNRHGMGMRWGLPVMGMFGWLFALLLPVVFIGLIVLGVILLLKAINPSDRKHTEKQILHCENCGRQVERDWSVCPHCGEPLGGLN